MNRLEYELLRRLADGHLTQRELADDLKASVGKINESVNSLKREGLLDGGGALTPKAQSALSEGRPERAVILAAGTGLRMIPINNDLPKGLLQVRGEVLVERTIRQLHEVGVRDITLVVGFMKESFEYLIDSFGVKLICNPHYVRKNNLHSLALAADKLKNAYVIPSDLYCVNNPYNRYERETWYAVTDEITDESSLTIRKNRTLTQGGGRRNQMVGIAYIGASDAPQLKKNIAELSSDSKNDSLFWESALFGKGISVYANILDKNDVVEITSYEDLRNADSSSEMLASPVLAYIAEVFDCSEGEIKDIELMKKGMTNRSFLFSCRKERYIMRVPGEGSSELINRKQEAAAYSAVKHLGISDEVIAIKPEKGYKITRYIDNVHVCDPYDPSEVKQSMELLRRFHKSSVSVPHFFDVFERIEYYESLREGRASCYSDYEQTKRGVMSLRGFIEKQNTACALTHVDAVPDNFLFCDGGIKLIDWEYASMQDPHLDIAMFAVYAMYEKDKVDELIDCYFEGRCDSETRVKIYCYVACCGLLWSNWCEYKMIKGVEFGEYSLRQYRFGKDFHAFAVELAADSGLEI